MWPGSRQFALAMQAFNGHSLPMSRLPAPQQQQSRRQFCIAAAQAHIGPVLQVLAKTSVRWGGSAALFAGAAFALAQSNRATDLDERGGDLSSERIAWVRALSEDDGVEEVLSPGQQLRRHPVGRLVVEQDHLFETMVVTGQIKELRCFYDTRKQVFYSVVELGKEVCGFPQTVHGGLTAALVDETLGGLAVALWRAGQLGFRPPAYTARLEVDYKRKIPPGSVILIATEVEKVVDRKVWMRATVSNGKGVVYATGRSLFVAPRWVPDWIQSITGGGRGAGGSGGAKK